MVQPTSKEYKLQGKIDFMNALETRQRVEKFIAASGSACSLDFSEVISCKSVILSLLVAWARFALQADKQLTYVNLTPKMMELIRLCRLQEILVNNIAHGSK